MGIFKSAGDFANGKLSFITGCNPGKNPILLNELFNKRYITIRQNDTCFKLLKKRLYGYQTCNGKVYRFFNKKELLLLNPGEEILIYKLALSKPLTGGTTDITDYYFSVDNNGEVYLLTIKNLKQAFNGNLQFQALVSKNFKYNSRLASYDYNHGLYKINWLLKQTEKQEYNFFPGN